MMMMMCFRNVNIERLLADKILNILLTKSAQVSAQRKYVFVRKKNVLNAWGGSHSIMYYTNFQYVTSWNFLN